MWYCICLRLRRTGDIAHVTIQICKVPHGLLTGKLSISADDNQWSTQLPLTRMSILQRLRILHGVGGRLPLGLPPQLEALEHTAEPAAGSEIPFSFEHLTAAAETILCPPKLKQLTVQHCLKHLLPLAFIHRLPSSLKVGSRRCGFVQMCYTVVVEHVCMAAHWQQCNAACPGVPVLCSFGMVSAAQRAAITTAGAHVCTTPCPTQHTHAASWSTLRQVATFERCLIAWPPECESCGDLWRATMPKHLRLTSCAAEEP